MTATATTDTHHAIRQQVLWTRLVAVVEEQALTMKRTGFSTSVREADDLSCGVFDTRARMLAQAVTGTPGHVNSMANAVGWFLRECPLETLKPGDVLISNNPWIGTGHLHDLCVVAPCFLDGRPVALFSATAHIVDIGGRGWGPDGRQVYEEGLHIPVMHLVREGRVNEDLLKIVRGNVREAAQVEGDVFSLIACVSEANRRLAALMREYGIDTLAPLADWLIATSERATREAIGRLRPGTYRHAARIDGYDRPMDLVATVTVGGGEILVDFTGTSPAAPFGINLVLNYTQAYASYGVKCLVAPDIPNNAGSLAPIKVTAPEGCLLNVPHPYPVSARHIIGHLLPDVVIAALEDAVPGGGMADCSAALWCATFRRTADMAAEAVRDGRLAPRLFEVSLFASGGTGARRDRDGLSTTAFPSGVRTMSVEVTESIAPVIIWRKELRPGSGGEGAARGGLGQIVEVASADGEAWAVSAMFERVQFPALGRKGGGAGAAGTVALASGVQLRGKGLQQVPAGERLVLGTPGGAGYGPPQDRPAEAIARDRKAGLI
ncbi:MAG: hydantoinase B/oxoprolinase family protein [Alphaproteobacteria bacterium]|nr:hydantoinase B/oxoprolinase family protein [Alphaproteobacteria bacterium]